MTEIGPPTGGSLPALPPTPQLAPKRASTALRIAWIVALAADGIQLGLPFVFGPLAFLDAGIDVVVMIVLTRLLGWHWAFLPAFAFELIPFVDLVPSWTAAVWLVSRRRK